VGETVRDAGAKADGQGIHFSATDQPTTGGSMKYEYDSWENFKAMFHGLGEDLKITVALLALTALPVYLAFWILFKLMEAA
jgi:hypothetical protein